MKNNNIVWHISSRHLRKEHNAGVSHGVGQAQDAAAHDGVAQVKHRHPEGSVARMLLGEREKNLNNSV